MPSLPPDSPFRAFHTVHLDEDGTLLRDGVRTATTDLAVNLPELVDIPPGTTDIFVFVHGWRNDEERAVTSAARLFGGVVDAHGRRAERYPRLDGFQPYFVAVHWPSTSSPLPDGYRMIRDRAHAMTSTGHAAEVIGALLGYLDLRREPPGGPAVHRTAGGQYLHAIGHSFGGRMLGEAITWAAEPSGPPVMGWPWRSRHPFTVDTFVVFQMAAPPDVFRRHFTSLVDGDAPITGPVVLTVSEHDRALARWHRYAEGVAGLGAVGATGFPHITLHRDDAEYRREELTRVTNVDAGWCYRGGELVQGAHSDYVHTESMHLLLSLADLGR